MPHDTMTATEWRRLRDEAGPPRRPPAALARDIYEAAGHPRHWAQVWQRRSNERRRVVAAVCVIMRRRGYTDADIETATGVRRPDSFIADADPKLVRRLQDRLRKAGR